VVQEVYAIEEPPLIRPAGSQGDPLDTTDHWIRRTAEKDGPLKTNE
jgi:hypothetical protein